MVNNIAHNYTSPEFCNGLTQKLKLNHAVGIKGCGSMAPELLAGDCGTASSVTKVTPRGLFLLMLSLS